MGAFKVEQLVFLPLNIKKGLYIPKIQAHDAVDEAQEKPRQIHRVYDMDKVQETAAGDAFFVILT